MKLKTVCKEAFEIWCPHFHQQNFNLPRTMCLYV